MPRPPAFACKKLPDWEPNTIRLWETEYYTGIERRGNTGDTGINNRLNSLGSKGTWAQTEGDKGGRTNVKHGGRIRHAAQGAEVSGGGWRLVGVGKVKVDVVPCRERRRGASVQRVRR